VGWKGAVGTVGLGEGNMGGFVNIFRFSLYLWGLEWGRLAGFYVAFKGILRIVALIKMTIVLLTPCLFHPPSFNKQLQSPSSSPSSSTPSSSTPSHHPFSSPLLITPSHHPPLPLPTQNPHKLHKATHSSRILPHNPDPHTHTIRMRISQEAITPDIDIAFATRFVELEVEAAEEGGEDGVEFCAGESGRGGGFSGGIQEGRGKGGR